MRHNGNYFAIAVGETSIAGKITKAVLVESAWWTGVVVDSVLGFSAILVCILGGVLLLRRWRRQRDHASQELGHE